MTLRLVFSTGLLSLLSAAPAQAETFLVVPFENGAGAADLDWVGESFAEALTDNLGGAGRTLVSREERLAALERLGLPPGGPLTRASLLRLGEELETEQVVLGRFEVVDSQVRAQAHVLSVREPALSPPLEESGSLDRLLDLQARLAWKILRHLEPDFPLSFEAFQQRFPRLSVSAFENYVRGLLAMNREQQVRYFLQAARLEPDFSRPALRLAQLYFEDMDYTTAARWFGKVGADDPLGLDARFYLALCQFFTQDFARATETLTAVAERVPVREVWNNLGVFASRQGDAAAARAHFARALASDANHADIHFNLGLHHLRRSEWEEAAQALKRSVELNPGDTEALFLRAQALKQLGRLEDAQRVRHQAVGDNPALELSLERRSLDLDRLAQQFSRRQALPAAHPAGAAAAGPGDGRARHVALHLERGEDLLARGQLEAAQKELTEAVLLDPDSARAHLLLGEIYQRQGRVTEAIAELRASLWSQESVPARLRLAELYLSRNRWDEAREQIRAALVLDPGNPAARALEARLATRPADTPKESTRP